MNDEEYESNKAQAEAQVEDLAKLARLRERQHDAILFEDALEERSNKLQEEISENALSVEVEKIVRIVLCTGGPHCEIEWRESCRPVVICYGWFGAGEYRRTLSDDEVEAMEAAYGDWDTLTYEEKERAW